MKTKKMKEKMNWEIIDNLPMCKKKLQLRRLQQQDQPLEQLDEVIEEIRRLMLESADTTSREKLGREKAAAAAVQQKQQQQQNGADENSKDSFGIQEDSNSYRGSS
jgi:hypothetical protein